MTSINNEKPKVSIGLPVYNGEKFIQKKLDSIIEQSFTNFEIIISDNASTDSTQRICEKYVKKDNRIYYFRQKKNMGVWWNYDFVLQKARYDYFLWTAVDDLLLATFLEKNIAILERNSNIACSISKMKLYGEKTKSLEIKPNDSIFQKIIKKIQKDLGYMNTFPASGNYEERVKEYIKKLNHNQIIYGIFRTKLIKKAHVKDSFLMVEGCTILNILKDGELFVIDEVLMHTYDGGMSRRGMLGVTKQMNENIVGRIFPNFHFTSWCFKNLSLKIFLSRLGFFIKINCMGEFSLSIDLFRKLKNFKT